MISLKSAHRWLAISYALTNMLFFFPVAVLFYDYKGVNLGDFFLIQGISCLFVFITEIPTGYMGDIFSRKQTLLIGFFVRFIGYLLWIFGYGFWFMLCGELFFALAKSLVSGTVEAYFYDLLQKRQKEHKYHTKFAKMETIKHFGLLLAILIGAFGYQFCGQMTPVWMATGCVFIALIIGFFLPDVPEYKRIVKPEKSKWRDILDISKFAIKHPEIKWLMIFSALYGVLTLVLWWGLQPVMRSQNFPILSFGPVTALAAVMWTFWSAISVKIFEKYSFNTIIRFVCILLGIAMLSACIVVYLPAWSAWLCVFLMAIGSGSVVLVRIIASVLINHRIKSDERATVLSVNSMIDKALAGMGMICLKPLFDHIGTGKTFMVAALLLIPILTCAWHLHKMKLNTKE